MTLSEAIETLQAHNAWRRDRTQALPMIEPAKVGEAIDIVCHVLKEDGLP